MQRSGSGWFETLLNSHINVSSNGEIFGKRERRASVSAITQTLDRVYNLDWLSSASKNECNAAVGFKWMLNQVSGFLILLAGFLSLKSNVPRFEGDCWGHPALIVEGRSWSLAVWLVSIYKCQGKPKKGFFKILLKIAHDDYAFCRA